MDLSSDFLESLGLEFHVSEQSINTAHCSFDMGSFFAKVDEVAYSIAVDIFHEEHLLRSFV